MMSRSLFLEKINKNTALNGDCWEWRGAIKSNGYGHITFKKKQYHIHRISYFTFVGQIPKDKIILHLCDNKVCINPFHLLAGTVKENSQDAVSRGRMSHGADRWNAKFGVKEAFFIKRSSDSRKSLAQKFKVCRQTVDNIKNGRSWRHLEGV